MEYISKVWLATLVAAPILFSVILGLQFGWFLDISGFFQLLFITALFGIMFSIPTFLILILIHQLGQNVYPTVLLKTILIITGIIGVFFTFYILEMKTDYHLGPIIYSCVLAASIAYFRITPNDTKITDGKINL